MQSSPCRKQGCLGDLFAPRTMLERKSLQAEELCTRPSTTTYSSSTTTCLVHDFSLFKKKENIFLAASMRVSRYYAISLTGMVIHGCDDFATFVRQAHYTARDAKQIANCWYTIAPDSSCILIPFLCFNILRDKCYGHFHELNCLWLRPGSVAAWRLGGPIALFSDSIEEKRIIWVFRSCERLKRLSSNTLHQVRIISLMAMHIILTMKEGCRFFLTITLFAPSKGDGFQNLTGEIIADTGNGLIDVYLKDNVSYNCKELYKQYADSTIVATDFTIIGHLLTLVHAIMY